MLFSRVKHAFCAALACQFHTFSRHFMTMPSRPLPHIRVAQPVDAAALATLARALLSHEQSLNSLPFEIHPWAASADELRKQIQQADTRFFIAELNEQFVGYLKVTLHGYDFARAPISRSERLKVWLIKQSKFWFDKTFQRPRANAEHFGGYIAGAYVLPEWRRSQVGRALVTATENWLREIGMPTSELHVLFENESAREFWASLGYEPLALSLRKKLNNIDSPTTG
jgi:ribosomal protein S18 acetylase RimI-like enzyme